MSGKIRVGIGGWIFEPWRGTFYPEGLRQKDELAYVGQHLTATEINATYYSTQKPATFAGWAKAVPDGFQFAVKASRYCTNRRVLAEGGESIAKFINQGLVELGDRLGPILWQFMPTKKFDAEDFGAFLKLLPASIDGVPLRHALEVRHESFDDPVFFDLARRAGAAVVYADHPEYPALQGQEVGFSYARLMRTREEEPTGYSAEEIKGWAEVACERAARGDVYAFFISGAKVRAPAAAQAMIVALQ
ncbi:MULTISPECIES: DUF72 domain-containing protein [Sphingobium]|uniref:DUF72 domain-containing protein n=1 Tax=Sphingobium fuliginis (strain ATCC 27551) TaxID=336203 RepID=A0ABQ1ELV3_SPHSA|nr:MULTISPECIES: DUF72 domain-containing protein [Sphingobium]AJR22858.1 hypothetical protein TZ53_02805 [Sphingobium sp. YBL2]RYM01221.1 DUF72 domain-containing protein [Sphingobium fuliginis]WDA38795.1 DUF72 domain-containing protein [Sphingobium sp. YC-XJ3]GFZ76968.1 hypothetical protein GCM10019071_01720 [Sphingobium fuliginis]